MYIALDIGGTNIRITATDTLAAPVLQIVKKIPAVNDYTQDLVHIISGIYEIANGKTIQGIGCGFPGTFSEDKKTILVAPNLSDWNNKQFVVDLEREFNCEVLLENDDTISALGEAIYGYGKGNNFVYVTWGTGFGGANVEQKYGQVVVKQFEAGHQIVSWEDGRLCGCGQSGCAEAYVGGGNIEKYSQKKVSELSKDEWDAVIDHLVNALINIVVFYPTNLIVIGGGVAINQRGKAKEIEEKIKQRLRIYPSPKIHITELGDELGLLGAFALLKN